MASRTSFTALLTRYTVITRYCLKFIHNSCCPPLSPRRTHSGSHGPFWCYAAGKSCSSADPSALRGKTSAKVAFEPSPSQMQQQWADRPVHPKSRLISASYPAIIPPPIPFHCSAHCYCAWNFPAFLLSTTSPCVGSKGGEATEPLQVMPEVQVLESSSFRPLHPFTAHRELHGKMQRQHPIPRRDFAHGRNSLLDRPGGLGASPAADAAIHFMSVECPMPTNR
jgi:hypothetical protein